MYPDILEGQEVPPTIAFLSGTESEITHIEERKREGENEISEEEGKKKQIKLRGFSPPANFTDRATAACRRS
jgi:hypothetical protein